MRKLKLFMVFYKSTLTLSLAFALSVAIVGGKLGFISVFGIAFMTGGWMLSVYYKEISYKNQYVYYQNMGITKPTLLIFCVLLNMLIGLACVLYSHA